MLVSYANTHQLNKMIVWDGLKAQPMQLTWQYKGASRRSDGLRAWDNKKRPIVLFEKRTDEYVQHPAKALMEQCLLTLHDAGFTLYHMNRSPKRTSSK